jgi:signal recognition particle subunit SRP54
LRSAAIEQLRTVAGQANVEFIESRASEKPLEIARHALEHARTRYHDVLIVDTAGRLAIDEDMMREIAGLHAALKPVETLFVVDAMQGQDAVNVARAFNERLPLTGVILTKLDGDARGGAALSVRHVTGKPIKFIGVGEKLAGIEAFHPDRMAARILGMGDILSLVEEAHAKIDLEEAKRVADKVKKGKAFDLEDFKQQIAQMKKMGGVASLLNAMTPQERSRPDLIKASRKRRIAAGAGVPVQSVNQLLSQFEQMQKMMKMMKGGNLQRMMRNMKGMIPGLR